MYFHPATQIEEGRIETKADFSTASEYNIYTDCSKSNQGVGTAYCAFNTSNDLVHTWQANIQINNSVLQAELTGISKAVKFATQQNISTKIWSYSLSSLQAILNTKTTSPRALKIQQNLIHHHNCSAG
ncbi:hypothetical protein AVEN_79321-1 [Araneus ventricosus]|uniref:RNase H type-1 domain-containing protein n=1 Tax=Araneus ventricosus TaxID=182803 RepID=A0A4Y2K1N7_ARAVE|nr:hypothetical protein AVEN_79321-1 [Araneus ventricosus]